MKKLTKILIIMFFMIIALSGMSTLTAEAAGKGKYFQAGELFYHTISKNKVEVCGTTKNEGTLTIPSSVYYKGKKYTVTQIADHEIYYQDTPITEETTNGYSVDINMPGWRYYRYDRIDGKEWPMNIDMYWISGCGITKVILPSTLTYIGEGAFGGCSQLKSVVFADSYKKLTIGKNAFDGTSLKSIRFPKGTYELKDCAAGTVQEIYIPATVKKIGAGVVNCNTKKVTIDKKNKKFKMKDGILYSYNEKTLISASANVKKNVKISKKTTKIKKQAFAGTKIKTVTLNNKITVIPKGAFSECTKLTGVKNTDNVQKIGYAAFFACRKLKDIGTLPNLTEIGRAAFWYDDKLTLHLSEKVINVDDFAFAGGKDSPVINITVDANNPVCSIENGFLMKTTATEKTIMMQMSASPEIVTIPEGVTNVAVHVGGSKCKQVIFPTTLKKQNGVARVKNGTITYQTLTVPELGQDFGLSNAGNDILTVVVPKGTLQAYKSAIDSFEQERDGIDFFMDEFSVIKEQE